MPLRTCGPPNPTICPFRSASNSIAICSRCSGMAGESLATGVTHSLGRVASVSQADQEIDRNITSYYGRT